MINELSTSDAFVQWDRSKQRVSESLQELHDAASTINKICNMIPIGSSDSQHVALAIDREITAITNDELRLQQIRCTLLKARNRAVAPFNALPEDVLVGIFSTVIDTQPLKFHSHLRGPVILSSVCYSWRQIVIKTRAFWRHIVFDQDTPDFKGGASLCLERARGAPLDVTIRNLGPPGSTTLKDNVETCLSVLEPHLHSLISLSVALPQHKFIYSVLALWIDKGILSSLKTLSLTDTLHPNDFPDIQGYIDRSFLNHAFQNESLESVQRLTLSGLSINWSSPAYKGLTELNLTGAITQFYPTIAQLWNVFAASPLLRTLRLKSIYMEAPNYELPPPIELCDLQMIHLDLDDSTTGILFSALVWPSSNKTTMIVSSFWAGNDVTELGWKSSQSSAFICGTSTSPQFLRTVLPRLSQADTFVCSNTLLDNQMLETLLASSSTLTPEFPEFRTIQLWCCTIFCQGMFRKMILAHPVRKLRLLGCTVMESSPGSTGAVEVALDSSKELYRWLVETVPDFEIIDQVPEEFQC